MPRTFTRPFRIRYYECDPYGHVNNANYLRYAMQAGLEATADAGYDAAKLRELGLRWQIKETGIEYLRPARAGETLNVKTWVSEIEGGRARREYEMSLGANEVAARAFSDWIFSDKANQPTRIPDDMVSALTSGGESIEAPKRDPFPVPPPPPAGAFVGYRRVAWHHLDPAGVVNSAWYLSFTEDVVTDAAAHAGWTIQRSAEAGIAYFARDYRIQILQPARLEEELRFTTYLSDMRRASVLRHYLVHRKKDNELLAHGQMVWVWVDAKTGRTRPIPPEAVQDLSVQMVASAAPPKVE